MFKKKKETKQFLEEYYESICNYMQLHSTPAYQFGCLCVENVLQKELFNI